MRVGDQLLMRRIGYAIFALVVVIDLLSKQWALNYFSQSPTRYLEVLPFLNFTLVFNKGVSFGWFSGTGELGKYALSSFAIIATIVLIWMMNSASNRWAIGGYGLIAGGAFGNAIDRFRHGAVVDFLDAFFGGWHFWTFNLADAAITIGVICLLIDMFVQDKTESPSG